ncbi:MAG: hypothetical protein K2X48_20240 [Chitinophagaceae bacterium]|nr:hypothetical protein [Chitinophagaceae bacterium]
MSTSNAGFYNLVVGANLQINGPDLLCGSSQTYSIESPGVSVSWSSSNTNIATIHPTTGVATPVQGASGTVTFTASVTLCGQTFTQTKTVTVAQSGFITGHYTMSVDPTQQSIANSLYRSVMVRRGQTVGINFTITGSTNVSSRLWTFDNLMSTGTTFSASITAPQTGYSSVTKTINLDLTTPCGIVRNTYTFQVMSGGWSMRISPNPATQTLNVLLDEPTPASKQMAVNNAEEQKGKQITNETKLSLFDANTNLLVRTWVFKETSAKNYTLLLNGIRAGVYILKAERKGETTTAKVIVQ